MINDDISTDYALYRKSINKYQFLHPLSDHAQHVKDNWVTNEAIRYKLRNSIPELFERDLTNFRSLLYSRGYTPANVEKLTNTTVVNSHIQRIEQSKRDKSDNTRTNTTFNLFISLPKTRERFDWSQLITIPHNVISQEQENQLNYARKIRVVSLNHPSLQKSLTHSLHKSSNCNVDTSM